MPKTAKTALPSIASVHRFHDTVAAHVGKGATTYLTTKQARALARALYAGARSVENEAFANSSFGTVTIASEPRQPGYNGNGF